MSNRFSPKFAPIRFDPSGVFSPESGLSRDDQAKLFQRGAKLTPRPTGGENSTGYGLAVAKELVEKLGGTIWCTCRRSASEFDTTRAVAPAASSTLSISAI